MSSPPAAMATDSSLLNSELEFQKQEELYQQLLLQVGLVSFSFVFLNDVSNDVCRLSMKATVGLVKF